MIKYTRMASYYRILGYNITNNIEYTVNKIISNSFLNGNTKEII